MRKRTIVTVAAAFAAVAAAMPANAASAKAPTVSDPIAEHLAGPLQLDVNRYGIAVAQSFSLTISKIHRDGTVQDLTTEQGSPETSDVAGVHLTKRGVVYTTSDFAAPGSALKFVSNSGRVRTIANLRHFEATVNPDRHNVYGFTDLSKKCADSIPADPEGLPGGGYPYSGVVDSHPYAIAGAPGGGWYVAEAAGNAILRVSPRGQVRTVAVFKPQPATITADAAAANGLPACTAGHEYRFEPVPTDVERARHGKLVVSLLPGGPEDPSLGARGKVELVDPATGSSRDIAGGVNGATNVAVSPKGIFVTNLFGDMISRVGYHGITDYASVVQPAALEWYRGKLYVGNNLFGDGSIVTVG